MGENHPGVRETPLSERERLERTVAWTQENVSLSRAAVEHAERAHEDAVAALKAHEAGEGR